jgi:tungstate transport system ATP-binding protein
MSPILELKEILVQRNKKLVLSVPYFGLSEGETLAVIGPNGAGKSTLMLVIAQLLKLEQGKIYFQGKLLRSKDGLNFRRKIGLVLQDPLLLDGTVFDNIATGMRFRGISRAEISSQIDKWLERLGISHLRDRSSHQLSGGEAQRVSLARAFAINPDILLLDEPFGALDAPTRTRLLDDFHSVIMETEMSVIFVTHDLDEALFLGDQVAVIIDGQLRQIGSPESVFNMPADSDVAAFVGVDTVIPGKVIKNDDGCVTIQAGGLLLEAVGDIKSGRNVFFCLRPEDITLWLGDQLPQSSARNRLTGQIIRMKRQGPLVKVEVQCCEIGSENGFLLVAYVTQSSAEDMGLNIGKSVTLTFKASAVHLIPR